MKDSRGHSQTKDQEWQWKRRNTNYRGNQAQLAARERREGLPSPPGAGDFNSHN